MSSVSVNGSRPKTSSSLGTRIAIPSESRPDSSKTRSSVRAGRIFFFSPAICWISEITVDFIDIRSSRGGATISPDDDGSARNQDKGKASGRRDNPASAVLHSTVGHGYRGGCVTRDEPQARNDQSRRA